MDQPKEKTERHLEDLNPEELNAVLIHKWYLSQKAGRDVGIEFALKDFFENYAKTWRKEKLAEEVKLQKDEILKHKWYLSEKLGYDVGTTLAALDWVNRGYAEHWRNRTGPYKDRK